MVSHQQDQDCAAISPKTFSARIRVIKTGSFSTAVPCRHCEDAPCANVCPSGAISRVNGAVYVEQALCIGCKSCMLACPFGAMQVTMENERVEAQKCDLCLHREAGPACVEACPTSALACIDPIRLRQNRLNSYLA